MSHFTCHVSCVMCHVSCVICQMSRVTCHVSNIKKNNYKVMELVGGRSVINGAYPVFSDLPNSCRDEYI